MAIDEIFQDNLKEKLSGILKEIPEWHLRGLIEVSLGYINTSKKSKLADVGCCLSDGRVVLDYPTIKNFPEGAIEFIFVHELGHNIFDSLLPFRIKHKWAKACKEKNLFESPGEIFASEYQNAIILKKDTPPLYNNMKEIFNFLEKNKMRRRNGAFHKFISYRLYSKTKSI